MLKPLSVSFDPDPRADGGALLGECVVVAGGDACGRGLDAAGPSGSRGVPPQRRRRPAAAYGLGLGAQTDWKLRAGRSRRMLVPWTCAPQWSCFRRSRTGVGG